MNKDSPITQRKKVLLTGAPGVGKTTVMIRLAQRLTGRVVAGFYTDEIRKGGRREGFRATTFSGDSTVLAHVSVQSKQRVGRYGVDVPAFEELVMPELSRPCDMLLIDEIGKMECFSTRFVNAVRRLLDASQPVIATIAIRGGGFIAEVKARSDVEIWQVTKTDRDALPERLARSLAIAADR